MAVKKKEGSEMGNEFLVSIKYTQHYTWQGTVTWVEKNRTVPFRSALELLKLIDSTMERDDMEQTFET